MVRSVGVETLFDGTGCYPQRLASSGRLDRLEVPIVDSAAYERLDLFGDLGLEEGLKSFFSSAA